MRYDINFYLNIGYLFYPCLFLSFSPLQLNSGGNFEVAIYATYPPPRSSPGIV